MLIFVDIFHVIILIVIPVHEILVSIFRSSCDIITLLLHSLLSYSHIFINRF
jgi:hypothetical protein